MDLKLAAAVFVSVALLGIGMAYAADALSGNSAQGASASAQSAPAHGQYKDTAEHAQFLAAVESGDYATAKSLHETYGFGGAIFGKLNATTFAKFSQIHKLRTELNAELGIERGNGVGMMGGFGMREGKTIGFGKGMAGGNGMGKRGGFISQGGMRGKGGCPFAEANETAN